MLMVTLVPTATVTGPMGIVVGGAGGAEMVTDPDTVALEAPVEIVNTSPVWPAGQLLGITLGVPTVSFTVRLPDTVALVEVVTHWVTTPGWLTQTVAGGSGIGPMLKVTVVARAVPAKPSSHASAAATVSDTREPRHILLFIHSSFSHLRGL
jgi:hypothetical protein